MNELVKCFDRIKNLDDNFIEEDDKIIFDRNMSSNMSHGIWYRLSTLLKINRLDRDIVNYLRLRDLKKQLEDVSSSTDCCDREINLLLKKIFLKLENDKVLDNVIDWFNYYDLVIFYQEELERRKNNERVLKLIKLDDWEIPDEVENND